MMTKWGSLENLEILISLQAQCFYDILKCLTINFPISLAFPRRHLEIYQLIMNLELGLVLNIHVFHRLGRGFGPKVWGFPHEVPCAHLPFV